MILHFETNRGHIELNVEGATSGKEAILNHYAQHIKLFMGVRKIIKSWIEEGD